MDGNVFSNSLATLGQWLLNNPQGTGMRTDSTQMPTAGMPTGVPAGWQGGQPGQPQNQLSFPQEQYAQPNLPGAQAAPKPAAPEGGGGSQPQQRPYAPQGGGGSILNTAQDPDPDIPALQAAGYDTSGMGGAAAGGDNKAGGAIGSALSGISSALSSAGKSIAGVNTMPSIVQGGAIPGINQQPMSLVGRRPQPRYV